MGNYCGYNCEEEEGYYKEAAELLCDPEEDKKRIMNIEEGIRAYKSGAFD